MLSKRGECVSDKITAVKEGNKPVLERRCICVFCLGAALVPAFAAAALVLVVVVVVMLTEDEFVMFPWWLGGRVDICILLVWEVPLLGELWSTAPGTQGGGGGC